MSDSLPPAAETDDSTQRLSRFVRAAAVGLLVLMAVTWPLWWAASEVPAMGISAMLLGVPRWCDRVLAALLVFVLLRVAFTQQASAFVAGLLAALMLLDQLRCQAWAWHVLLALLICGSRSSASAKLWGLRVLTLAVYFYAALAKCDVAFVTTLGQQFLGVVAGWLHVDVGNWSATTRNVVAGVFPLVELVIPLLLLFVATRSAGVVLAVALHAALVVLLSPLGLGHSWGVVLWNVVFAMQTWLLFAPRKAASFTMFQLPKLSPAAIAALLVGAVAPVAGLWSWWEPWPSWALYAPQRERIQMLVVTAASDRLPASLQMHASATADPQWQTVDLDAWCLAQQGAPLYPGTRVPLALALAVAEQEALGDQVEVVRQSAANRLTDVRTTEPLRGVRALRSEARVGFAYPR